MTSKLSRPYTGTCLCGAIQYEVGAIEPHMGHCHCSMCRKFHGAAFATYGEALTGNFRWTSGQSLLTNYTASNGTIRQFCSRCGSSMTFASAGESKVVEFALGTLDSEIEERADAHIFTNYKANWVRIDDDLACFGEGRENTETTKRKN